MLLAIGAGASAATDGRKGAPVRLGGTTMSPAEVTGFAKSLTPEIRSQALSDSALMKRLIQLEIIRRAILREALAKKWQERPDVAGQIETARNAIVLKAYLASKAAVPAGYPSEKDIQAAYDLNRTNFMTPRQYRLAQIFLQAPADPKQAQPVAEKAAALARQARNGAKFEILARRHSQHQPSAEKGGDMGWAYETQLIPEIRKTVSGLRQGEVSVPIRSGAGWHIVKMLQTRPASVRPLAEVRPLIVSELRQRKEQEGEQKFVVQMLQKSPVEANEAEIRNIFRSIH